MDIRLGQTQTQKMILTPQLRQFLKLLELPVFELEQKIQEELTQNPALEEAPEAAESPTENEETPADALTDDRVQDILEAMDHSKEQSGEAARDADLVQNDPDEIREKHDYRESILSKPPTLADYLEWQLAFLDLSEPEKRAAREIIGDIDEDGRFTVTHEEIARTAQVSIETVQKVLAQIQTLEPPGVGAKNLQEALLLQLRRRPEETTLAQTIVRDHFSVLERKQFDALAKLLHTTPDKIKSAYQLIGQLEPKPGRIFYQENTSLVVPEATVSFHPDREDELVIELHHERIPELRINGMYRRLLKQKNADAETKAFLREKIQSGVDLIRAMAQRKSTIRQITEELVRVQRDFFFKGFAFMKPLRLKDVAEVIKVHESTVSRAIQAKYLETPQGTIPYKSFFSTRLEFADGGVESQAGAMERVRRLIDAEDKRRPLSDAKLVKLLEQDGIKIARRTVAKYRDLLKILPTHLRKT